MSKSTKEKRTSPLLSMMSGTGGFKLSLGILPLLSIQSDQAILGMWQEFICVSLILAILAITIGATILLGRREGRRRAEAEEGSDVTLSQKSPRS